MHPDNKLTDNKFQELENQSLPDLSKMDEHWEQMKVMIQSGQSTAKLKSPSVKYFGWLIAALLIGGLVLVTSKMIDQKTGTATNYKTTLQPANPGKIVKDTIPAVSLVFGKDSLELIKKVSPPRSPVKILKVKTTDGIDTSLKVLGINSEIVASKTNASASLNEFFDQLQKQPQHFVINNQRDTSIYGKEGTVLFIPANAFDTKKPVKLLLREFYSYTDMITNRLTTTTADGKQLVTGGMAYMEASSDDSDSLLGLREGATIRMDIPKLDERPMELFYGKETFLSEESSISAGVNWERTGQVFQSTEPVIKKGFIKVDRNEEMDTSRTSRRSNERRFDRDIRDIAIPVRPGIELNLDSLVSKKYSVNLSRLGWINCDRFNNDNSPRIDYYVNLDDTASNYYTFLVFSNIRSIIPGYASGNRVLFPKVPQGQAVKIISVGIQNGKAVSAMKDAVISPAPLNNLAFEQATASEFKKEVDIMYNK